MEPNETPDDAPAPDPLIGTLIGGRYRIERQLGEGGMGVVYAAEHMELGKRVAMKVLRGMLADHPEIVARFKREARAASAIESEHIVQVFDVGQSPECGLFMVMELLRGRDLAGVLEDRGSLDPVVACGLVLQVLLALERAHEAGIVHRDLKPPNIFLCRREDGSTRVKLLDFGIAKVFHDANQQATRGLTRIGTAIGTPHYMSPEQAQGLPSIDHRTDLYSLGAVLFESIVGEPPFPLMATYEQTILQILTKTAPRLRDRVADAPQELDDLLAIMMHPNAEERFPDARSVRDALLAIYPGLDSAKLVFELEGGPSDPRPLIPIPGDSGAGIVGGSQRSSLSPVRVIAGGGEIRIDSGKVRRPSLANGGGSGGGIGAGGTPPGEPSAPQNSGRAGTAVAVAFDTPSSPGEEPEPPAAPEDSRRRRVSAIAAVALVAVTATIGVLAVRSGTPKPVAAGASSTPTPARTAPSTVAVVASSDADAGAAAPAVSAAVVRAAPAGRLVGKLPVVTPVVTPAAPTQTSAPVVNRKAPPSPPVEKAAPPQNGTGQVGGVGVSEQF